MLAIPPRIQTNAIVGTTMSSTNTTMASGMTTRWRMTSSLGGVGSFALTPTQTWWRNVPIGRRFFCSFSMWLIACLTGMFIASVVLGGVANTDANPTLGTDSCHLLELGAKFSPLVVRRGQVWRLISANVLPSGLLTYFVYVLLTILLVFPVEFAFGTIPVFVVFWVSGIMANVFSCSSSMDIDVGEGGALMGIVGFRVASFILCWSDLPQSVKRRVGVLEIFSSVLLFFTGLAPNVDNAAHFAGFIMGAFLGSAYFANQLDAAPMARSAARAMAASSVVFCAATWISLLASGDLPLIENVVIESVCPLHLSPLSDLLTPTSSG